MHPVSILASLLAFVIVGTAGCGTKGPLTLPTAKPGSSAPEAKLAPANHSSAAGGIVR
jgi:predicted small lipoprotein YifL